MTPQRIAILRKQLAQLEAERADRVRRGATVPAWFDHMLDKRRAQLREASAPPAMPAPTRSFAWMLSPEGIVIISIVGSALALMLFLMLYAVEAI